MRFGRKETEGPSETEIVIPGSLCGSVISAKPL